MTYKTISDDEVTVVLTQTSTGKWKAVAITPDIQHAEAYIAYQDVLDAARNLYKPLGMLINGSGNDLENIAWFADALSACCDAAIDLLEKTDKSASEARAAD